MLTYLQHRQTQDTAVKSVKQPCVSNATRRLTREGNRNREREPDLQRSRLGPQPSEPLFLATGVYFRSNTGVSRHGHLKKKKKSHLPENRKIYSRPVPSSCAAAVSYHSVAFLLPQHSGNSKSPRKNTVIKAVAHASEHTLQPIM